MLARVPQQRLSVSSWSPPPDFPYDPSGSSSRLRSLFAKFAWRKCFTVMQSDMLKAQVSQVVNIQRCEHFYPMKLVTPFETCARCFFRMNMFHHGWPLITTTFGKVWAAETTVLGNLKWSTTWLQTADRNSSFQIFCRGLTFPIFSKLAVFILSSSEMNSRLPRIITPPKLTVRLPGRMRFQTENYPFSGANC